MLPAKQKRQQANDHQDGVTASTNEITSPIELTQSTGMRLLDLNEDCLREIFSQKALNIIDLCSVAQCCKLLKEIACQIFAKPYKKCDLSDLNLKTIDETRIFFHNFGSLIDELEILWLPKALYHPTLELIAIYCSKLEALKLFRCEISPQLVKKLRPMFNRLKTIHINDCTIGDETLLFNCASLVELRMKGDCRTNIQKIQFPKLEKLERFYHIGCYDIHNLESFISKHKNLKELYVGNVIHASTRMLPVITNNCQALEKLQVVTLPPHITTEFGENLNTLLTLRNLKEVKIVCRHANINDFVTQLPKLTSLEVLELSFAKGDSALIAALSQLEKIKKLHFICCKELGDLNPLSRMEQLNELWIIECGDATNFTLNKMIKGQKNLKELVLSDKIMSIDTNFCLEISEVVRKRPYGFPSFLKLGVYPDLFKRIKNEVRNIVDVYVHPFDHDKIENYIEDIAGLTYQNL